MIRRVGARALVVLRAIADYIDQHGLPPAYRDIAQAIGISTVSTIHSHVVALRQAGLLINHATRTRALVLTREGYLAIGRDQHPPSHLMPSPDQQPRMQLIPRHVADALGWLCNEVSAHQARGRTVPGYMERIAQWWDKIRRDDIDA